VHGVHFLPRLVKPLDKAKAIREEKGRAAIDAGGDELKFPGAVNAVVEEHGAGGYTLDGAGPEDNVPSGSQGRKTMGLESRRAENKRVNVMSPALPDKKGFS
jgi:hypothetical protein